MNVSFITKYLHCCLLLMTSVTSPTAPLLMMHVINTCHACRAALNHYARHVTSRLFLVPKCVDQIACCDVTGQVEFGLYTLALNVDLSRLQLRQHLHVYTAAHFADVCRCFSEEIDLRGMQVDDALRKFQSYFRMPVR